MVLLAAACILIYKRLHDSPPTAQRSLTRLTFDEGLQAGATWSPDSRFIAYGSNRGGKFDIWVQQVSGGDPVQITRETGQNWQPDWSPDGKSIAYRSEAGDGGLFVVPALGGEGMKRKIASFGYYPRWSPDSSQILFQTTQFGWLNRFYVANLEGAPPREVLTQLATNCNVRCLASRWQENLRLDQLRPNTYILDGISLRRRPCQVGDPSGTVAANRGSRRGQKRSGARLCTRVGA